MKRTGLIITILFLFGKLYGQFPEIDRTIHALFMMDHDNYKIAPIIPLSYSISKDGQGQIQTFTYKCLLLEYMHNDIPNELVFIPEVLKNNNIRYKTDGRETRWGDTFDPSRGRYDENNRLKAYDMRNYINNPILYYKYDDKGRLVEIKTVHRTIKRKGKKKVTTETWTDCNISFTYDELDRIIKKEKAFYQKDVNNGTGTILNQSVTTINIEGNNYLVKTNNNGAISNYSFEMNDNLNPISMTIRNDKDEILKKYDFEYNDIGKISFKREEAYVDGKFTMASEESYTYDLVVEENKEFYTAMDYAQRVNFKSYNKENELIRETNNNKIRYKMDGNWSDWEVYIVGIPEDVALDYNNRKKILMPEFEPEFRTKNIYTVDSKNLVSHHILGANINKKSTQKEGEDKVLRSIPDVVSKSETPTQGWEYYYDIFGRLETMVYNSFKGDKEVLTFEYDELDHCISGKQEILKSGSKSSLERRFEYQYIEDRGYLLKRIYENGNLRSEYSIINDSTFSIISKDGTKEVIELQSDWQNYVITEYTSKGNPVDITTVKNNKGISNIRYSYKKEGDKEVYYLRKEVYYPSDGTKIEKNYDGDNRLIYERDGDKYRRLLDGSWTDWKPVTYDH